MLCDKSASTYVKASQGTALALTSPWCRFELIESETSETKAKPVEEMYPTCAWFPNFQTQQVQFIYQGWSKMEMSVQKGNLTKMLYPNYKAQQFA